MDLLDVGASSSQPQKMEDLLSFDSVQPPKKEEISDLKKI
jgi:hypothetical protein